VAQLVTAEQRIPDGRQAVAGRDGRGIGRL